jgi:hypothetical protein
MKFSDEWIFQLEIKTNAFSLVETVFSCHKTAV